MQCIEWSVLTLGNIYIYKYNYYFTLYEVLISFVILRELIDLSVSVTNRPILFRTLLITDHLTRVWQVRATS